MSRLISRGRSPGTSRWLVVFAVAAVSVSACGGSGTKPEPVDAEGTGGGGGEAGEGGTGGGGGSGGSTAPRDGGAYDAPPVPGSIPLPMAPALVAGVVCAKTYACCQPTEGIRALTMTQATCDAFLTATLAGLMTQANAAIAAGRAMYDPAALAACLQRYTAQSCPDARMSGGLSAYRMCDFVKPLVAVGGVCQSHVECVNGYCLKTSDAGVGVDGTCAASKPDGQACAVGEECQGRRCASQACTQPQVEGLCTLPAP